MDAIVTFLPHLLTLEDPFFILLESLCECFLLQPHFLEVCAVLGAYPEDMAIMMCGDSKNIKIEIPRHGHLQPFERATRLQSELFNMVSDAKGVARRPIENCVDYSDIICIKILRTTRITSWLLLGILHARLDLIHIRQKY
jgi:hypothetical protein